MPLPIRTKEDLIGRQITVHERLLVPKARQHKYAFFRDVPCKVISVVQNGSGAITCLHVVKPKVTRYREGKMRVAKWMLTKHRIPADVCAPPIRRVRRKGNAKFRWHSEARVTIKGGVGWEQGRASLGGWLNNHELLPFTTLKRIDENKIP